MYIVFVTAFVKHDTFTKKAITKVSVWLARTPIYLFIVFHVFRQ